MAHLKNRRPGYATGPAFDKIPKAVWADLAVSFALRLQGEEDWSEVPAVIMEEWRGLHAALGTAVWVGLVYMTWMAVSRLAPAARAAEAPVPPKPALRTLEHCSCPGEVRTPIPLLRHSGNR